MAVNATKPSAPQPIEEDDDEAVLLLPEVLREAEVEGLDKVDAVD